MCIRDRPKTEGRCDNCSSELTIRKDDSPETVKARLEVYHRETEPLKAFYAERAIAKGIEEVVFDRGGYIYHGRVQALSLIHI